MKQGNRDEIGKDQTKVKHGREDHKTRMKQWRMKQENDRTGKD